MNVEAIDSLKKQISYFSNSPRSYFDSSSFTLVSNLVLDAVHSYYKNGGSRPSTGLYPGTSLSSVTIETCRASLKDFFSISSGNILFPLSRGIGITQLLYSFFLEGSFSILPYTGLDHDIWLPIFEFSNQKSLDLIPIPVKSTLEGLEEFLISHLENHSSKNRVIILPFTSLGNGLTLSSTFLSKIKSISNTFIILDCTFAVGVTPIHFSDLQIDAAVFDSNVGLGGPMGSGVMYVNDSLLNKLYPYIFLGNGTVNKVSSSSYSLDDAPQRVESSINPSIMAGLSKAIELLNQLSVDYIQTYISSLKVYFFQELQELQKNNGIKLVGSLDPKNYTNIIGFIIPNINMHEVAMYLDEVHNIDIRSGSFCAHQLIDQLYGNLNLENSNLGIL